MYINSSENSVAIVWHNNFLTLDSQIEYSTNKDLKDSIMLKPDSIVKVNDTYIYTTYLNDLLPGKTYYYQISSDLFHKREIMKFKTIPKNHEELKFLLLGDTQTIEKNREVRKKLIKSIKGEDFDFFIHLGDIVEKSKLQNEWNEFF
ncbi:MAG: FN3 domain-containing metallophosphoesterase family protein, partial [Candidatus Hermodarchaeota archaeon]